MDPENPICQPFQRLKDAHNLWHRAEAEYHDPDGFRINLNSCIQELRNVTFVLQKQKSEIPNFENNYEVWRNLFKADLVLKWLNQARNVIVKQGDLETKSIARIYVIRSYLADPYTEFEINPLMPLDEIPNILELNKFSNDILENGYLKIERRWVAKDLPDFELLGALKRAFFALLLCLDYFQKKCSTEKRSTAFISCNQNELAQDPLKPPPHPPSCMDYQNDSRNVLYKLKGFELVDLIEKSQEILPDTNVLNHYGDDFLDNLPKPENSSLNSLANYLFSIGKKMLVFDGHHDPIAFLILPSKKMSMHKLIAEDQADKYVLWKQLAKTVHKIGANIVISINEVWWAPFDSKTPHRPAKDSPDRKEALQLVAVSNSGEEIVLSCQFERSADRKILLGETEEGGQFNINFLAPVRQVWQKNS